MELHLWNLSPVKFILCDYAIDHIYEHFEDWIMLISFFCLVVRLSVLFKIDYEQILKSFISKQSPSRCSMKIGVPKNFINYIGKHLYQSLFSNKVAGLRSATLLKKSPWHRCFPVNFGKFLRTPFYRTPSNNCFCIFNIPKHLMKTSVIWLL